MKTLPVELVRELFDYDNGHLIYKTGRKAGQEVGHITQLGRIEAYVNGVRFYAHRLIFVWNHGYWPKHLDHIDRNPLNNKIDNLREVCWSLNNANKIGTTSSSGFRGVTRDGNRWRSQIVKDGQKFHLGCFDTAEEASLAYVNKRAELFPEIQL